MKCKALSFRCEQTPLKEIRLPDGQWVPCYGRCLDTLKALDYSVKITRSIVHLDYTKQLIWIKFSL